jgi:hypothetical protein
MTWQIGEAGVGNAHAPHLEMERLGHDADGEDAHLARDLGDDGRRRCLCRHPCRR